MEENIVLVPIVAGVAIKKDGRYLLVQEKLPKAYGLWNWPAGRVEKGKTIEETAVQEAKEETGYDVRLLRKIEIFQKDVSEPPQHVFSAEIIGGALHWPEEEILTARWFAVKEIHAMKDVLRSEWILDTVKILGE